MQASLVWSPVRLVSIALDARANDVLPRRGSASVAWNDVVQIEIFSLKYPAAVLAGVLVPLKDVVPSKLDLFLRQTIEKQQENHLRNAQTQGDAVNTFVVRFLSGKIGPLVEVEGLERAVGHAHDDLGVAFEEQRKRAAHAADVDGLPQPNQDEHLLVEE